MKTHYILRKSSIRYTAVLLGYLLFSLPGVAQKTQPAAAPEVPSKISMKDAKGGFTPSQAAELMKRTGKVEALKGGDVTLFGLLNFPQVQKTAVIARSGQVMELETTIDENIGDLRFTSLLGDLSLDQYLADPRSRMQGLVVVHKGKVVFEQYPGMKPLDYHAWMSVSKTSASLMLRLLEEDGLIDVNKPLTDYLDWLKGTEWEGVKVIDALDMRTGMNVVENSETRADPNSIPMRVNLAGSGTPYKGKVEAMRDVLRAAKRTGEPGKVFEYGSPVTLLLPFLCEAVTDRRWPDLFQERVWGKMGVEGDMLVGVSPEGLALAYGFDVTRLRDLARYGMLYTPSWNKAARERIVSEAYVKELMKGGDPEVYRKSVNLEKYTKEFGEAPRSNHYQWDAIFADGDFYKAGLHGQGLYVSPSRDVVVVFFSTVPVYYFPGYARVIAKYFEGK